MYKIYDLFLGGVMYKIDDYDEEACKAKEKMNYRFTVNFKKIFYACQELTENNAIQDEKYPKNILYMMLGGIGVFSVILLTFSYKILLICTIPFMVFNIIALVKVAKVWKEYKYKKAELWLWIIAGFIVSCVIAYFLQQLIFG